MKTSLHFEAPSDLSVGTVRIAGEGEIMADWVATPDNRTFEQADMKPGIYSAEIGPAGLAPQSVVFEVHEGRENTVVLPTFSALSSSGSNTSFFDTETQLAASEIPPSISAETFKTLQLPQSDRDPSSGLGREKSIGPELARRINISTVPRRISIGLSQESRGFEAFDTFRGQTKLELRSGRLEIEVPSDMRRDPWAGRRVRLSVAFEQVRIERCLLPLYRGGTRISVTASPFAAADLELSIVPADPKLRALVRALDAGTSSEAAAVRDDLLGGQDLAVLLADDADPWAAILVGLLAIRFPDVFPRTDQAWADDLVERAGWAFDAHVIRASRAIAAAEQSSLATQNKAVTEAVANLARAQVAGSPYYRYTNQLFGEMSAGIAGYLKTNDVRVDRAATRRFERLHSRWYRELPLQRGAGSTFTWLARDQAALKERKILVPYRTPSGKLQSTNTTIIFEGQVSAGQISFVGGASAKRPPWSENSALADFVEQSGESLEPGMPALSRSPGPSDDPNRGRFGGEAARAGYHLAAAFEPTASRSFVAVALTVEADRSAKIGLGDYALFVLHPTFSPPVLKVPFRGSRASLRIQTWGGFTVGVWLPKAGVELEIDLSQLSDAPKIIKTR